MKKTEREREKEKERKRKSEMVCGGEGRGGEERRLGIGRRRGGDG